MQKQHPALYARVLAWLMQERSVGQVAGSHHDTRAWVRLAERPHPWVVDSIFQSADPLWRAGLDADEQPSD